MEPIKLHIGKMTSREIAEWLGISYSWYKHSRAKQLHKVEDFCRFNEFQGGIEIYEIFGPNVYDKAYTRTVDLKVLAAIGPGNETYNTYANIANIAGVTPYQAAKSAKKFFGPCFGEDGLMGWRDKPRYRVEEYDIENRCYYFRDLTKEERQIMRDLFNQANQLTEEMALTIDNAANPDPDATREEIDESLRLTYARFKQEILDPLSGQIGHAVKRTQTFIKDGVAYYRLCDEDKIYVRSLTDELKWYSVDDPRIQEELRMRNGLSSDLI